MIWVYFFLTRSIAKTLLFDNYKLSEEQSNTWTVLPVDLEVCEPSGIEQMLVQTSTELMPEIVTNRISVDGGYIDVIEDLQSETSTLTTQVSTLEESMLAVEADVEELQTQTQTFTTFFQSMRDLFLQFFPAMEATE